MQKAKLSLIAAALLVPAFALSAYAEDFVRPMLTRPIQAGPTLLGGEQPVICSPLVGKNLEAIKAKAETDKALNPDMVEVAPIIGTSLKIPIKPLKPFRQFAILSATHRFF